MLFSQICRNSNISNHSTIIIRRKIRESGSVGQSVASKIRAPGGDRDPILHEVPHGLLFKNASNLFNVTNSLDATLKHQKASGFMLFSEG